MSGGQIAALIFAILLLLPGGCFVLIGIAFLREGDPSLLLPGLGIFALAGLLFWVAFRRRLPTALVCAIALLAPGALFLIVGINTLDEDISRLLLPIAAAILSLAGLLFLFWLAFRRRPPLTVVGGGPPQAPPG